MPFLRELLRTPLSDKDPVTFQVDEGCNLKIGGDGDPNQSIDNQDLDKDEIEIFKLQTFDWPADLSF